MKMKKDIIREVYRETGYRMEDVKTVLDTFFNLLQKTLEEEDVFKYDWFKIKVYETPERPIHHIIKKEYVLVPKRRKPMLELTGDVRLKIIHSNGKALPLKNHVNKNHKDRLEEIKRLNEKIKEE